MCLLVAQLYPNLCDPVVTKYVSIIHPKYGSTWMYPTRLLYPWDFPGKNTGMGCHFFLQGISPTQGSNPCLSHLGRLFTIWATRETHHKIDDQSWKRLHTQRQENLSLSHLGILTQNQFSSVAQLCPILCDPWTAACQASLSIINSQSLLKLMCIESVMPSNHLILCHPLLLLPSIFPSILVFSNESVLHIRWPNAHNKILANRTHQHIKGIMYHLPRKKYFMNAKIGQC